MKALLRRLAERDKFTLFFCSLSIFIIAVTLLIARLSKPQIISMRDLDFITGQLSDRKFYKRKWIVNSCSFMLKDYPCNFYIDKENFKSLDLDEFSELIYGRQIIVGIAKKDLVRLKLETATIYIFSLKNEKRTLLDAEKSIQNYNSKFAYYIVCIFIATSLFLFYLGHISTNKTKPWK